MNFINKKVLTGLVVLILIGVGIGIFAKSRKPAQTELQKQTNSKIDSLMSIINDPKSTKADVESAWLGVGIYYESLGQKDQEEQAFIKASETDPNSYLPWSALGSFYTDQKQYDKASIDFQKALTLPAGSQDPQLWLKWLNFIRYTLPSPDERIREQFNEAYKATNNNDLLLRQGASYLEDVGDIPEAIKAWQFVLKQNPNDATVKAEIVRLQKLLKK